MAQKIEKDIWKEFEQELKKAQDFKINFKGGGVEGKDHSKFWEIFLNEKLPEGQLNTTLEKHFAIWILENKLDLAQIKKKYKAQGWKLDGLMGWIKKVQTGEVMNYNTGELVNWCKQYRPDLLQIFREEDVPKPNCELLWEKDLGKGKSKKLEFLIEKIIPKNSVGVLSAKRSSLKTWLAEDIAICLSKGIKFLGFPTEKINVLYYDRENGEEILTERNQLLKNGREINSDLDIGFLCYPDFQLDTSKGILELEDIIKKHNFNFLIVDTYRRAVSFKEDSADETNNFITNFLKPLIKKCKPLTILFINHDKKGMGQGDEMDEIRGSSDLPNNADFVLKLKRKSDFVTLSQPKLRGGREIEPIKLKIETDEKNYFKFVKTDFVPENKEEQTAQIITNWIMARHLKEFKTGEAEKMAFSKGIKKTKFYEGLQLLQDSGMVIKKEKGVYGVSSKDLKLCVW